MTYVSTAHFLKVIVEFGKLHLSFILVLAVRQLSVAYRRRVLKKDHTTYVLHTQTETKMNRVKKCLAMLLHPRGVPVHCSRALNSNASV